MTIPNRTLSDLHPVMRQPVANLMSALVHEGLPFRFYEGYRSPERQDELFAKNPRVTRARAWESSHQYGLAADFVGRDGNGQWSWDERLPWDRLDAIAASVGLVRPIRWDRPHLEHPAWALVRARL